MFQHRNKLYLFLLVACLAGYVWLFYNILVNSLPNTNVATPFGSCIIKNISGIPCPSCGSTRSIIFILKGDFLEALSLNPLGYLSACIMLIIPLWIGYDLITKKNSFFVFYKKVEVYLRKPMYMIPLAFLFILNWVWNILKEV